MNQLEDAIFAWVLAGSGLAASSISWALQNIRQPGTTHITMRMRAIREVGSDWLVVEDNPTPSAGAEILHKLRGVRRVTLTITCFADEAIGAAGPMSIVSDVIASAGLPSRGGALAAAGVGISSSSDVLAIEGVVGNTTLEPRATADVVFYATSELVETGTYIEHVVVTDEIPTPDEVFTI